MPPQFSAAPARWVHGQRAAPAVAPTATIPDAVPRAGSPPGAVGRLAQVLFALEAAAALAYGLFALVDRRAIFTALATDPAAVSRQAAVRSDNVNVALFVTALAVTAATVAALLAWATGGRAIRGRAVPTWRSLGAAWWVLVVLAVAAVTVALVLHAGTDPARIALGYDILGAGTLLVAAASLLGLFAVRRAS